MTLGRHAASPATTFFVIVVIIVAAGVGAASYVSLTTASSTTHSTTTQSASSSSTSSGGSNSGLRLRLSVSPTLVAEGGSVLVNVSLFNTLPTPVTLAPGNLNFTVGPCSQLPLGIGLLSGNYGSGNLSQGQPLDIYQPGYYNCPALFNVAEWSFSPMSDNVTLVSEQPAGTGNYTTLENMWTQPAAAADLKLSGYWPSSSAGQPTPFGPGVYTLVAEDEWGDIVIVHFSATTGTATNSSSSSGTSTTVNGTVIIPTGTTYQVQSSYDCLATHVSQQFNVSSASVLRGAIGSSNGGIAVYVATSQQAKTIANGHPASWVFMSTDPVSLDVPLPSGSYVIWIEGEDQGCGATIVEPLEMITTVTVTQAVTLNAS